MNENRAVKAAKQGFLPVPAEILPDYEPVRLDPALFGTFTTPDSPWGVELDAPANSRTLNGTAADDIIIADASSAALNGGAGNDFLLAAEDSNRNTLTGGDGDDFMVGGLNSDTFVESSGINWMIGGGGANRYLLEGGLNYIQDFNPNLDSLELKLKDNKYAILPYKTNTEVGVIVITNGVQARVSPDGQLVNADLLEGVILKGITEVELRQFKAVQFTGIEAALVEYDATTGETIARDRNTEGTEGNDTLTGSSGNDTISGGAGDDTITGGRDNGAASLIADTDGVPDLDIIRLGDVLRGDDDDAGGSDTFIYNIGDGFDLIEDFDPTQDKLVLKTGGNTIAVKETTLGAFVDFGGGKGVLLLDVEAGDAVDAIKLAEGDKGSIRLVTGDESVAIPQPDTITSEPPEAPVSLIGMQEKDVMATGSGDDTIIGLSGDDILNGGNGSDVLLGGDGNDRLIANNGNNALFGDNGNDVLVVNGSGNNLLWGGKGADTFIFDQAATGRSTVQDFKVGEDKILLNSRVYNLVDSLSGTFIDFGNGNGLDVVGVEVEQLRGSISINQE